MSFLFIDLILFTQNLAYAETQPDHLMNSSSFFLFSPSHVKSQHRINMLSLQTQSCTSLSFLLLCSLAPINGFFYIFFFTLFFASLWKWEDVCGDIFGKIYMRCLDERLLVRRASSSRWCKVSHRATRVFINKLILNTLRRGFLALLEEKLLGRAKLHLNKADSEWITSELPSTDCLSTW